MGRGDLGLQRAHGGPRDGLTIPPASTVACAGCGYTAEADDAFPFSCPHTGTDDVDHVMVRKLDPARVRFPTGLAVNPFLRYRTLFHAYHLGREHGLSDEEHVRLVARLDEEIRIVDGVGFAQTRLEESEGLSRALGCSVWVKDETRNVSRSHKARHLMGLMIHLLIVERIGLASTHDRELAIASCGNAALAAAVVARAAERPIRVFVPTWADPAILERLGGLGATIEVCPRTDDGRGDPTYQALRRAVQEGAIPFTCQGPDNGLTIEGGETLGFELVTQLLTAETPLDRLFVQVGGGALASACIGAFEDATRLGAPVRPPRFHAVQPVAVHPLARAFARVRDRVGPEVTPRRVEEAMAWARSHRSHVMWPWEQEPASVAEGIVDDETYDWAAVVAGMLGSDGGPVLVSEERLHQANDLARRSTGIDVSHTGSAGLAGLLELAEAGAIGRDERVGVIFTGARRGVRPHG